MKVKIPLKIIFITLVIAITILVTWRIYSTSRPLTRVYFNDIPFEFRDDVREAIKVPAYPDESSINKIFWNYRLSNITILFN